MAQVIDVSVAIAWGVPSQADSFTTAALLAVIERGGHVPSPFWFEVLYALSGLQRRKIASKNDIDLFVSDLARLGLTVDRSYDTREMIELRRLSQQHSLNIYDAAYLDLALRLRLPLATRDASLVRAANATGVVLFTPDQAS